MELNIGNGDRKTIICFYLFYIKRYIFLITLYFALKVLAKFKNSAISLCLTSLDRYRLSLCNRCIDYGFNAVHI